MLIATDPPSSPVSFIFIIARLLHNHFSSFFYYFNVVSVADVGSGVLTALVRCGGASVPHSVRSQGSRHELVYHPSRAAPHTIMLFYNGVPVSRRPLRPNVLPPAVGQEVK